MAGELLRKPNNKLTNLESAVVKVSQVGEWNLFYRAEMDLSNLYYDIAELKKKLEHSIQFNPSARVIHGDGSQSDLETIVMNYGTRKAAQQLARLYELAGEKAGKEFAEWMKESEEE